MAHDFTGLSASGHQLFISLSNEDQWERTQPRLIRNPPPTGAKFRTGNFVFWKVGSGDWLEDNLSNLTLASNEFGWPINGRGEPVLGTISWRTSERG